MLESVNDTGRLILISFALRSRLIMLAKFAAFYEGFSTESFAKCDARVDETPTSNPRKVLSATVEMILNNPT